VGDLANDLLQEAHADRPERVVQEALQVDHRVARGRGVERSDLLRQDRPGVEQCGDRWIVTPTVRSPWKTSQNPGGAPLYSAACRNAG
jgi:hypothetical protein